MKKMSYLFNGFKSLYFNMSLPKRAAIWFVFSSFIQRGISFLVTPIFTRIMTVSEFGEFNEFLSWQSILIVIVTLNLPWGVFEQGLIKFDKQRDEFASSLEILLLVLILVWTTVYTIFKKDFNQLFSLSTSEMIAMLILMWTSSIFSFWATTERVNYKYIKIVSLTIVVSIMKPALGILFITIFDNNVEARIWSIAVSEIICYIPLFFAHLKNVERKISGKIWIYAIKFNIALIPHYLSQSILSGSDRIMISRMVSSEAAGLYSLSYSLSSILLILNSSLFQALNPIVFMKIKEKKYNEISRLTFPSLIVVGTLNILLILFSPEIIALFAPVEYSEAIWIIPPISLSVFFMYMYSLFSTFEFYFEKTKFISVATTLGAILNLVLNYFFIDWFGYIAAGYTTLFCYIFYAVCHYLVMRFSCLENKIEIYSLKSLFTVSVFFLLATIMITLTYKNLFLRYGVVIMIFVIMLIRYRKIYDTLRSLLILR